MVENKENIEDGFVWRPKIPESPVGWLEIELPKSVMKRLQSYIETAKKNQINWNHELAGNISKSIIMEDKDNWFHKTVLIPFINIFYDTFPDSNEAVLTKDAPYCLDKFWVNFQKENEFNPLHEHSGILSFVIWVKIPTDWKEQHALPISDNSNTPKASNFEFYHPNMLGKFIHTSYLLSKELEGMMLLFPAKLQHTVYPFYNCDKDRISISGNIKYNISENSIKKDWFISR